MAFFDWSGDLDVGVKAMNDDHQTIIRYMNDLFLKNSAGAPHAELSKVLNELAAFTQKHFHDEEAHMRGISFPGVEVHAAVHKQLLSKFGEQMAQFEKGGGLVQESFFDFLKLWLSAHIRGVDRKYADHSKVIRVKAS